MPAWQNRQPSVQPRAISTDARSNTASAYGTGVSVGKVSVSDFSVMKSTDSSSPVLFQKCCDGSVIPKAVVTLQRQVSGQATPYLVYQFENVYVTSIQWSGSGGAGDAPMESVSFCFETGEVDYTPQKDDGSGDQAIHGGWHVGTNTKK